jgi:hypothetical protein
MVILPLAKSIVNTMCRKTILKVFVLKTGATLINGIAQLLNSTCLVRELSLIERNRQPTESEV